MAKRPNGEGSIFQRKDNGLWVGTVTLSIHPGTGKATKRSVYGKTQKEVQAKLKALKKQQDEGTLRTPDRTTIAEWSQDYLRNAQGRVKAGTYSSYVGTLNAYVLPYIGRIRLEKLTARDVAHMVDTVTEEKGARVAQYARTLTSMMLNYAVSLDMIPRNVAKNTKPPKAQKKEMLFWQPQEVRDFLKHIEGHRLEPFFQLALTTGMRKAELLGLRWQDLKGDTLSIRQTVIRLGYQAHLDTPKTYAGQRDLILDPDTLTALRGRRAAWEQERTKAGDEWQEHDLIFPNVDGTPMIPWRADYAWRTLRDTAPVTPIRFHDLRHTYASLAIASGMDVRMLAERLGHADASITLKVYSHIFHSQRRRAAIALGSLLDTAERTATHAPITTNTNEPPRTSTDEKAV